MRTIWLVGFGQNQLFGTKTTKTCTIRRGMKFVTQMSPQIHLISFLGGRKTIQVDWNWGFTVFNICFCHQNFVTNWNVSFSICLEHLCPARNFHELEPKSRRKSKFRDFKRKFERKFCSKSDQGLSSDHWEWECQICSSLQRCC